MAGGCSTVFARIPLHKVCLALLTCLLFGGCDNTHDTDAPSAHPPDLTPIVESPVRLSSDHPPTTPVDLRPWQQADINWQQFAGTRITVLGDAQGAFESLQPLLPVFQALTGIEVGMILIQQEDMRKRLRTDLASGGGVFDVVPKGITDLGEPYHAGWILPLQPFIDNPALTDPDWFNLADFSPQVLRLCQVEGHLLSLPFDFSAPVFLYRKDLFERYGIDVPQTYAELVTMKRQLQAALDGDGIAMDAFTTRTTVGSGDNTWTVFPVIRAYGGQLFDERWQPRFNTPEVVSALRVYRDMVTGPGSPRDNLTQHFTEQRRLLRDGKLASAIFASHIFAYLNDAEQSAIAGKWDAAPPPAGPAGRFTSPWAWAFAINAGSKQPQAAWLFMQWAASAETAALLGAGVGPARRSAWTPEYAKQIQAPGMVDAYQWIFSHAENDPFQMGIAEFPSAGLVMSKAFNEIFYGAPIQKTLDDAVLQVEQIMAAGTTRAALAP